MRSGPISYKKWFVVLSFCDNQNYKLLGHPIIQSKWHIIQSQYHKIKLCYHSIKSFYCCIKSRSNSSDFSWQEPYFMKRCGCLKKSGKTKVIFWLRPWLKSLVKNYFFLTRKLASVRDSLGETLFGKIPSFIATI